VDPGLTLDTFIEAFQTAVTSFREATRLLGGFLDPRFQHGPAGFDGHRGTGAKFLKGVDESAFRFLLSWIESPQGKGWVRHIGTRGALPFDVEHLLADVLGFRMFKSCPDFDFEPCFWTFTPQAHSIDPVASQMIHASFDGMPQTFPSGLAALAAVEDAMRPVGMEFPSDSGRILKRKLDKIATLTAAPLPAAKTLKAELLDAFKIAETAATTPRSRPTPSANLEFDIAISFAGAQREVAEKLARLATAKDIRVFYDKDHAAELWGEDLTVKLDEIYRERARFCVPIVSREYAEREWPRWELRSARARAVREKGAYILPLRIEEGVALEGVPETIGYISLDAYPLDEVIGLLLKKLGR
jgi:hypothetical protein